MLPTGPMEMFEIQNEQIGISPLEDPLSRQLSLFEKQMELPGIFEPVLPEIGNPVLDRLPQVEKPVVIIPGGQKSDSPPVPEGSWTGFRQPPIPGFGSIRSSRTGIRNSEGVWCFHKEVYVDHDDCMSNECGYWDADRMECVYMECQREGEGEPD